MTIDIAKLRAATAELGYQPATTDDEHLEKLRADNERFDRMNAHDPYHSPCPVCGRPTRFKQWPTRCACNQYQTREAQEAGNRKQDAMYDFNPPRRGEVTTEDAPTHLFPERPT